MTLFIIPKIITSIEGKNSRRRPPLEYIRQVGSVGSEWGVKTYCELKRKTKSREA